MSEALNNSELVKSVSIENLLRKRAAFEERLIKWFSDLDVMAEIAQELHAGGPSDWLMDRSDRGGCFSRYGYETPEKRADYVRRRVDASVWQYLFNESGMRTFMDNKARQEWDSQIRELKCPPLDYNTVAATFEKLYESRGDLFERGVIEVFRRLSWNYKTNSPMAFGKKIIMDYMVSYHPSWGFTCTYSERVNQLDDLERIMYVLADLPVPDHRESVGAQYRQAVQSKEGTTLRTRFFDLKWYKKGSMHVTFRRLDLVRRMNDILAKHFPDAIGERL